MNFTTRKKIYEFIVQNPGLALSSISERLNIPVEEIQIYLQSLEKNHEVISSQEKDTLTYYPKKKKKNIRLRRTQEIRDTIYELLKQNPGLHQSKIAETLEMSIQLAKYHLLSMERRDLITGMKEEGAYYRRFYIKDSGIGASDKIYVDLLRQQPLFRIVVIILRNPGIQHKDIADRMNIHPSTLTYHMSRLVEKGIIDVQPFGRDKGYRVHDKKEVTHVLRKYVTNSLMESFADLWNI
jgi:predicted transcriptional regulator